MVAECVPVFVCRRSNWRQVNNWWIKAPPSVWIGWVWRNKAKCDYLVIRHINTPAVCLGLCTVELNYDGFLLIPVSDCQTAAKWLLGNTTTATTSASIPVINNNTRVAQEHSNYTNRCVFFPFCEEVNQFPPVYMKCQSLTLNTFVVSHFFFAGWTETGDRVSS